MRLTWTEDRDYEFGVDHGVFFPKSGVAEAWTGLISVERKTEELRHRVRYRDGVKVLNQRNEASFSGTISAFSLPKQFRARQEFDFSYRTNTAKGYKLHLIYNAIAVQPPMSYGQSSVNPYNVDIVTRPVEIPDLKPSAHIIVDTAFANPPAVEIFENVLYGTAEDNPRLPEPKEIFDTFYENARYKVIDNGDGTFSLDAPDESFDWVSETLFGAEWPVVVYLDDHTYQIDNE